ncbi:MAG TPA: sulfite exporter TauE/SafE family protein [Candidatus Acidoferrales bacterium]|nr:sulfite exporter TauE/SafE family protein [Candidatus Acidoferrales bacterium]
MSGPLHPSGPLVPLLEIAIGAGVGFLIGLTGLGSGSLLTPLLILAAGFSPTSAVAASLVFSCLTKFGGSIQFIRRKLVNFEIVRDLLLGGLPGVLAGAAVFHWLGIQHPEHQSRFLVRSIGLALILVAVILLVRLLPEKHRPEIADRELNLHPRVRQAAVIASGFIVGIFVSVTSIGAGAALMPVMVLCYRMEIETLVGSNVFASAILAAVAALPHAGLGNVPWVAVAFLLAGSLPAMWIAGHLHGRIPSRIPQGILAAALLGMGLRIFVF